MKRIAGGLLSIALFVGVCNVPTLAIPRSAYEGDCVFCWIDGSETDMPIWSTRTNGYTHQPGDPREQIVWDDTFAVRAGRSTTITNSIIWIRPQRSADIEIFGTLVLENCLLLWDQDEHQQTRLRIKRGGTLHVTDTYSFSNNAFWVNWEFEDGATVWFDHFVGDPWTSIWGAVDYESFNYSTVSMTIQDSTSGSTVEIENAHHLWLELFPPKGSVDISFARKRRWVDWVMDDLWPDTLIDIDDSYLYQRDISLSPGTNVTVRNTTDGFSIGWAIYRNEPGFVECELVGLGTPGSSTGTYYANRLWSLPAIDSSLRVINSRLEKAWPTTWGNMHLVVRDSNLADPRVWDGPATYEIYDSSLDHAAAYREGLMYLEGCTISGDIEVKNHGTYVYGYGLLSKWPSNPFQIFELDGGQFIELEEPGRPW